MFEEYIIMNIDIILYSRRAIDLPEYAEKNFFGENCKIIYAKAEKYPGKVLNKALKNPAFAGFFGKERE